jgi:CHAD domain-containing protein
MIQAQYREIVAHDPGTRLGTDPEALHKLRVAVRRLRTVLRVARPMLDRDAADELRAELAWLAGELGAVRDLDVLLSHLRRESKSMPIEDVAAMDQLLSAFEADREAARGELNAGLSSDRYLALLGKIELAADAPPWNGERRSLRKLASKEFRKLNTAVAALGPNPDDQALHRARVRGKRARYAAELAEPSVGKRASEFVARAKVFQDVIGEHQDAVVAEARLRELARKSADTAFVAGRLAERQRERRRHARAEAPKQWKKLRRAGRKAWG